MKVEGEKENEKQIKWDWFEFRIFRYILNRKCGLRLSVRYVASRFKCLIFLVCFGACKILVE